MPLHVPTSDFDFLLEEGRFGEGFGLFCSMDTCSSCCDNAETLSSFWGCWVLVLWLFVRLLEGGCDIPASAEEDTVLFFAISQR